MICPPQRRHLLHWLGAGAVGLSLPPAKAQAAAYPARAVRVLVGSSAGGPSDFMARLFSETLSPTLGQPFVVDNKAGASGTIAAAMVAKAPPDGYTLLCSGPAAMVVAPHLFTRLDYDPERDFTPLAMLGAGAFVLAVHPSVPAQTLGELVALAKARPGSLNYGSGGNGSSGQLCTELFAARAGIELLHVPYKGDGAGVSDLLAGQIQLMFTAPNVVQAHVKSGKLRALAVTSYERMAAWSDVPSVHETLADFEYLGWIILYAQAATPAPVLDTLSASWAQARNLPAVKAKLDSLGMSPPARYANRAALLDWLRAEKVRTALLVKKLGITPA